MHNFKYALKTLFKNKVLIFWTFAFPIILGTFFNMAFSSIEENEKLHTIPIAIVKTEELENNKVIKETFKSLSNERNKDRLFDTMYTNLEEAKNLLDEEKVVGYLYVANTPQIVIRKNGIEETILKQITEEILETENMIKNISEKKVEENIHLSVQNKEKIDVEEIVATTVNEIVKKIENFTANIENTSNAHLSYTMIEYYTLIAMACLYGGILGMVAINQNLANMSNNGKRVAVSPTSKMKLIVSSSFASYLTELLGIILLFLYTIFVLKVDYGKNLVLVLLLAAVGSLAGLTMGIAISCVCKANENTKVGIIISITMLGCFLSGMMGITMKYIVDTNLPFLNKINPARMITDGFYSLYYYDTLNRYCFNLISLLGFSILMLVLALTHLRRQKYDSI